MPFEWSITLERHRMQWFPHDGFKFIVGVDPSLIETPRENAAVKISIIRRT
jgi:hypothetical protein